jgi:hypothetical protein
MAETNWQEKCEKIAADNERLRTGLSTIRDRAADLPHVVMRDGTPLREFCRHILIGPTELPPAKKVLDPA